MRGGIGYGASDELGFKAAENIVHSYELHATALHLLGLDHEKVNVYGGACAQGHPIGSTGSRLIVTLAHALNNLGKKRGIAALCIGGGEATAIALERS